MNRPADPMTELVLLLTVANLATCAVIGVSTLPTRDRVRELENRIDMMEKWHPVTVHGAAEAAVAQGRKDSENAERMVRR
jgi:hypothetical protein